MKILALESSGGQRVCRAHRGRKTGGAVLSELRPDALAHAAADGGKPAGKLRRIGSLTWTRSLSRTAPARLPVCASVSPRSRVWRSARTSRALGVSTLEAMAWGARALGGDLCCVMDARAGQVYNALFTVEDGKVRRLCDDRAIKLTELAEEIGEAPYFLVGDGADLCYNTIKENCTGLQLAPAELRFATGFGVAAAALPLFREGKACSPQELDAFYLRRPQAERERMARLAQTKQQTTPHN